MLATTLPLYSAHDLRAAVRSADPRQGPPAIERLDRPLACFPSIGRLEVQVGTPWQSVGTRLATEVGIDARAFTAAFAPLGRTVGGAVDTLPPLPDGLPFSHAVASLALVTTDGELRCATRTRHPELFRLVLGGHGAIAVPYSVTLSIPALLAALRDAEPLEVYAPAGPSRPESVQRLRFYVPPARLHEWLAAAKQAADELSLPLREIHARRARPGSESFLDAVPVERVMVDLYVPLAATPEARTRVAKAGRAWIDHALAHEGTFDLATGLDASREQVEAGYPRFSAFLAEARRLDPPGRLAGRWLQHYVALFARARAHAAPVRP